jgi:hypothetical protein
MTTMDSELAALFLASTRNRLFNEHWPRLESLCRALDRRTDLVAAQRSFEQRWQSDSAFEWECYAVDRNLI